MDVVAEGRLGGHAMDVRDAAVDRVGLRRDAVSPRRSGRAGRADKLAA